MIECNVFVRLCKICNNNTNQPKYSLKKKCDLLKTNEMQNWKKLSMKNTNSKNWKTRKGKFIWIFFRLSTLGFTKLPLEGTVKQL